MLVSERELGVLVFFLKEHFEAEQTSTLPNLWSVEYVESSIKFVATISNGI